MQNYIDFNPGRGNITPVQETILHSLYYQKGFTVGRDRLLAATTQYHPEAHISQGDVSQWLRKQTLWQTHTRSMISKSNISPITTGLGYCQLDLKFYNPPDNGFIGVLNMI